jgi:ABC-2 type transport system permease protein
MRRILHLLYIGIQLAKANAISYVAYIVSTVLWLVIILVPATLFSNLKEQALLTIVPGVYAMFVETCALWTSTEFLRWLVYTGLPDLFRECGLSIYHYLLSYSLVDAILASLASHFLSMVIASAYLGIDIGIAIPKDMLCIVLAIALAIPVYMLIGTLMGYLLVSTSISSVWSHVINILMFFGTVIPLNVLPNPWLALVNPATIVAELFRAGYGTSALPLPYLFILTPTLIAVFTAFAKLIGQLCEKRIAKFGLEYRY